MESKPEKLEEIKEILSRTKIKSYKKYLSIKVSEDHLNWIEREICMALMGKDKNALAKVFNTVKSFTPESEETT